MSRMRKRMRKVVYKADEFEMEDSAEFEEEEEEEEEEESEPTPPPKSLTPSFKDLVKHFTGQGNISGSRARTTIARFFKSGVPAPSTGLSNDSTWLTLLSLYILEEKFFDRDAEWKLIAGKAKTYLGSRGIEY